MSDYIRSARCCGCDLRIDVKGCVLAVRSQNGDFDNAEQVREAARKHRSFCKNYTGKFRITAAWFDHGVSEWHIEVSA
jgi:hypothetical protein